jgi:hypothetical protein
MAPILPRSSTTLGSHPFQAKEPRVGGGELGGVVAR